MENFKADKFVSIAYKSLRINLLVLSERKLCPPSPPLRSLAVPRLVAFLFSAVSAMKFVLSERH